MTFVHATHVGLSQYIIPPYTSTAIFSSAISTDLFNVGDWTCCLDEMYSEGFLPASVTNCFLIDVAKILFLGPTEGLRNGEYH